MNRTSPLVWLGFALLSTPAARAWAQDAAPETVPVDVSPPPPADTGTVSGTVRSSDLDAPLAGVAVSVGGAIATTDAAGHFEIVAPAGPATVRATMIGFHAAERPLTIAAGQNAAIALTLSLDRRLTEVIVIVGARTPRTRVETTVPVDVVTAEDVAHVGKTETGRVLSTLAPSFLSTPQTVSDGTDHVDPASLRGLGPDQVLVLVNGKRRHKSALVNVNGTFGRGSVGTDLNAIPVGSIERIEVLRDGAASQYGSDAIAGVINIVTRKDTGLVNLTTTAGITGSGDGAQIKTSGSYGIKIGQRGFINITGEVLKKEATNRTGDYTGPVFSSDPATDDQMLADRGLSRKDFRMKIGEAEAEDLMGAFNLEIPVESATFYGFGDLGHRSGAAAGFYRFPFQTTQNVPELYPMGFLPEIHSNIDDLAATVGFRRPGPWAIDVSVTHGRNSFQFNIENSVNASYGTLSPTTFDAGTLSAQETVANVDVQRKLGVPALDSLVLVLGMEARNERYQIAAGDQKSWDYGGAQSSDGRITVPGAQVFPGFQPANEVDRDRTNIGVYAGIETEIVKGLHVDVGGRYEHSSDFGNALIGKAAVRVPIGGLVALRAAASTGFRAPSLQQLWFNNVSTVFILDPATNMLAPNQVLTSNNASPITRAFGIPKLDEERSLNFSAGVTFRPLPNLSLTADAYFIRIDDRIALTATFPTSNAVVRELLAPFQGVTQAQFFTNAVDTETRGLDIVADYSVGGRLGRLTLGASANLSLTRVEAVHIPQSLRDAFGDDPALQRFFFGRLAQGRLEDAVPHHKGTASARYELGRLSAMVRADYYGGVKFLADDPMNDEEFGAKVLLDVDLGFRISKQARLTLGADNLLNTFPDAQTKPSNISFGRFVYSRNVSQFGQNGGFYYSRLELTF